MIEPGEEQTVYILLGCENSRESAAQLAQKYSETDACEHALEDVHKFWEEVLGTVTFRRHALRWTSC